MHQLFYLALDPERALGIEDLFPSYHILYSENSQLAVPIANAGIDIKNFPKPAEFQVNSTSKMLENPEVIRYIKLHSHETPDLLVFKNDELIESLARKNGFNLRNPSFKLGQELENKINFSKFAEEVGAFKQPEYEIFEKLSDLNYSSLSQKYGIEFVIQFIFGHTGSGTFFIHSKDELEELKLKYPLRKGKISRKIKGYSYTINACITKLGVVIGGLTEQITGIPELTSSLGGTVGNDFTQRHLNDFSRSEIISKTMQFGEALRQKGHKGIFGLDFLIEKETNEIYVIEANIRQVASSTYASYLQRINRQVPIMLWHALELLDFDFEKRFDSLDEEAEEWINDEITNFRLSNDKITGNVNLNQPIEASQVFFRNTKDYPVQILDQFPTGIYRMRGRMPDESSLLEDDQKYISVYKLREDGWSTLCLEARGYNILEARERQGFIVSCAPEKTTIDIHGEIGRIQTLQSAFSGKDDMNVNGWMMDVIKCVYENVRTIKFDNSTKD